MAKVLTTPGRDTVLSLSNLAGASSARAGRGERTSTHRQASTLRVSVIDNLHRPLDE